MNLPGITGILCAVETEAAPFITSLTAKKATSKATLTVHEGMIANAPVAVVCCGVCKVNAAIATQVLLDYYHVSRVVMSGTAGGIDRRLKVGDTVVSTDAAYHDVQAEILVSQHPRMKQPFFIADAELIETCKSALTRTPLAHPVYFGRIVTGEAFITTEGREDIIARMNPLCVDMETAAAAHVCYVNEIPFLAVRSISDTEDNAGVGAFFQNAKMASEHSYWMVKALLNELTQTK